MTPAHSKTPAPKKPGIDGTFAMAPPWQPAEATRADVGAIQALVAGTANEYQQQLVVKYLMRVTCVKEMEFRPESDRASAFAAGKRFVGVQFFQLATSVLPAK
jgi:hypothetical protein